MLVAGQDHGQLRFGLTVVPETAPATKTIAVVETRRDPAVMEASFAPPQPVMSAPAIDPADQTPATPVAGRILYVDARSVNVRAGPGKDFEVVERLNRDEAVLVVVEGEGADGWSLIRIEGDGVEGYVATRLLRE